MPGRRFTIHMVKEIKEKFSFVGDTRDPVSSTCR
jgi:hypothetical protein